jgi:hypothetical protein
MSRGTQLHEGDSLGPGGRDFKQCSVQLSELDGVQVDDAGLGDVDGVSGEGLDGLSLRDDLLTGFLGSDLLSIVFLNALNEGKSGLGQTQVLKPDVEALLQDAAVVLLVDDDTDGLGSHVENAAGLAVVVLVRHTLVDRTVGQDVDVISQLVGLEVARERGRTMLLVRLGEQVSGSRSDTK